MISRHLETTLIARSADYPVVTLTGPRQSGKTTLCRSAFPEKPYSNLERPDTRDFAMTDPSGYLAQFPDGAVIDEIQRVPELLSWIQVRVDENKSPGEFILTGSHQFELRYRISQSLAGRTALLNLLPLSIAELKGAGISPGTDRLIHAGGYPRIHADNLDPAVMLGDYFATYVERDLRELVQLRNIREFEKFVRFAAGRTGQLVNLQSLASDTGVSHNTAKSWLSLLEASFIVFILPPWFANIGKRLVKSPKLYFYDVGLAAWLMGITKEQHLEVHPLRGQLFENLVVVEMLKARMNGGMNSNLYYYRDSAGLEIDLLLETGNSIRLAEIKSSATVNSELFRTLNKASGIIGERVKERCLVYGGNEKQVRSGFEVIGFRDSGEIALRE